MHGRGGEWGRRELDEWEVYLSKRQNGRRACARDAFYLFSYVDACRLALTFKYIQRPGCGNIILLTDGLDAQHGQVRLHIDLGVSRQNACHACHVPSEVD